MSSKIFIPVAVSLAMSLGGCATMNSPSSNYSGMYGPGAPGYYSSSTGRTAATEADVYQAETGAALAGAQAAEAHADLGVREHEIGVDRQAHRNEYLKAREQQAVTQGNIRTYQQGTDAVVDTSRALWSVRNLARYW